MNIFNLGFTNSVDLPDGHFLYIGSHIPELPRARRAAIFNYAEHHYNPLHSIDYPSAVAFTDAIAACFPAGGATLTREAGLSMILKQLLAQPKSLYSLIPLPEKRDPPGHLWAHDKIQRILLSPILRDVLDPTKNQFHFSANRTILARIDSGQLTYLDAKFLTHMLVNAYKGQVVIDDYGPYALPSHIDLLRQNRLIVSVKELKELPEELRGPILYFSDITTSSVHFRDAVVLAELAGHSPDPLREDNEYTRVIRRAMER